MPKIIDFSAPEDEFESILDMEDEMEFQPAPELDMPFSKKLLDELNTVGFKVFVEYYKDFSDPDSDEVYIMQLMSAKETYEDSVCQEKIAAAKSIIAQGLGREALQIILCSNKVDSKTVQLAEILLQEE